MFNCSGVFSQCGISIKNFHECLHLSLYIKKLHMSISECFTRCRDSAVCSLRLLKDMMDASLKDPVCHPDAQLGAGYGWPLRTKR